MDRRIRQVAAMLTFLLVLVALTSGYVQGIASEQIANRTGSNPDELAINRFRIFQECRWERGPILSADGVELARSDPSPAGRKCKFERRYPAGELVAHVVGQWSLHFGKTGLEAAYNRELVGEPETPTDLEEYFSRRPRVGLTVVSTIDTRLQRAALDALGGRRGAVVALAPRTGAVLVAASIPSYDPNPLASNDRAVAERARCGLGIGAATAQAGAARSVPCHNPNSPLVSLALQARRPPGSSFKVVTAAAALESGKYTTSTRVPFASSYTAPGDTRDIGNFGGGSCGGTLLQSLTASCNTAFARIAVDVGADQLSGTADAMGLDQFAGASFVGCDAPPTGDVPDTRTGCLPTQFGTGRGSEKLSTAGFRARAGFGQWRLQVSPYGMAVVAATVANGGFVPRPRFADRIIDSRTGALVRQIRTGVGIQALSPGSAEQLTTMMRNVVTSGTGRAAFSGFGVPAAGKTGTAQQPSCAPDEQAIFGAGCGRLPHAWFLAFAPVTNPAIAIAVLVERGGGNNEEATGGRLAAPVARKVLEAFFELYPAAAER
jgi:peptidoglycan glycosyltransferase